MPLATFPNSPAPAQDFVQTPPHFPEVPEEILQRFPSAQTWNDDLTLWYKQLVGALGDQQDSVTSVVNANDQTLGNVVVKQGDLTVAIETETTARITAEELIAQRIVTVSALAGTSSHISVQGLPPGAPAVNDLWVNNSNPITPITYKWSGVAWVEVTEPISVAAVASEQTARITADGYLEGKYSLTVIAGNVVTGMNITSASGPGVNISSVIFRATDFQIYNSVTGIQTFSISGTTVLLAGTLAVSTSGKVYIGAGNYGNSDTAWFVNSSGQFSLKDTFTWDGTNLAISGNNITFASTNRVIGTDNASFTTWQGPAGANTAGFYTQQSAAGGGFSAYGVGSGSPLVGLYRSGGSYGAPSNLSANSLVATVFVEGYLSGAYNEVGRLQWGTIATGNTNYFKIEVSDAASASIQNWVFNFDGKIYFTAANDVFSPNSALYASPYMSDPLANIYRSTTGTIKTDGNFVAAGGIALGGSSTNPLVASAGRLYFQAGGTLRWFISDTTGDLVCESSYQIKKGTSDGWTVKLFDGASALELQAVAGQIFGRINGGAAILLG